MAGEKVINLCMHYTQVWEPFEKGKYEHLKYSLNLTLLAGAHTHTTDGERGKATDLLWQTFEAPSLGRDWQKLFAVR